MNYPINYSKIILSSLTVLLLGACATEQTSSTKKISKNSDESFSAKAKSIQELEDAAPSNPLKNAYFGETHMHTAFSLDAYIGGNRMMPQDSLQFAQGMEKMINGKLHKIDRPLDFAATTDHAEYIGEMYTNMYPEAPGHDNELLKELRSLDNYKDQIGWFVKYVIKSNRGNTPAHPPFFDGNDSVKSAWQVIIEATKAEYKPGVFTTLAAFEWSGAPKGGNLHRNVIFRDMVLPDMPVSYIDVNREEGLWDWMSEQEKKGSTLLAIPHNSNASKLMMFNPNDSKGKPITTEYAQMRNHFERLIEMMQIKGNSEVHRKFWSADEFADFENADSLANYSKRTLDKRNYVRWGSIEGLKYTQELGVNPYKYGYCGGTDSHNGVMSDVAEDNFIGGHGIVDSTAKIRQSSQVPEWLATKDESIGSITGVWAHKNTRADIWDAMYTKETFVTSGPRIQVRLFAGVDLKANPTDVKEMAKDGYKNGVPMGGTIIGAKKAPTMTVWAIKDNTEANLDRIQLIKGWVDKSGKQHEKIINVVWSDDRKKDKNGNISKVGNTVNLKTAKYTNTIGAVSLIGSFTDSEFDPSVATLYYARVIDIPTPRWTTYDAVRNNLPLLTDVQSTIQERAWSSPIWFVPQKENEI